MAYNPIGGFSSDFILNIAKGNVPGHAIRFAVAESTLINTTDSTLWDISDGFVWPTAGEAWEIVSSSASDTSAGTGARSIVITGLDDSYNRQTEIITPNGTSAVATTRTDWLRIESIIVISSGSNEANVGTITLRILSAGNTRSTILPDNGRSFNGFYTAPVGKTAFILQTVAFTPKGEDTTITTKIRGFGTNTWLSGGQSPTYQSAVRLSFASFPAFPEKSDLEFTAKSTNTNILTTFSIELVEIDNDLTGPISTMGVLI